MKLFFIDLAPNRVRFGTKPIGKVYLQSKFGLDYQDSEKLYPRAAHCLHCLVASLCEDCATLLSLSVVI